MTYDESNVRCEIFQAKRKMESFFFSGHQARVGCLIFGKGHEI